VQIPPTVEEAPGQVLEGEGLAGWMMTVDFADEYVMVAEISDFEALELRSLAEAKHRPDWQLWEKSINKELVLLQEAGTWELTELELLSLTRHILLHKGFRKFQVSTILICLLPLLSSC
jgi:hypothetical protein